MKRNRAYGKFMTRNVNVISFYTATMAGFIFIPLVFGNFFALQLGGITLCTTVFLGYLNYQHVQDRLFKDLFREFNERYDKFNDEYQRIKDDYDADLTIEKVDPKDVKIMVDYLNLCTEEYFWYEKGRIEETAWKSWESGMQTWAKLPAVKTVFFSEVTTWTTSYYTGFQEYFRSLIDTQ
ncbi:MAG: hypothetical protein JWR38_2898 [Mucilaginibacter sp.]|nr:hypothetical protein [Mucilaginibacter sp.]